MFNILQNGMEFHQSQLAFHINISYSLNHSNQELKANKIYIKDYPKYIYKSGLSKRFFLYQQKVYKLIILSTDLLIQQFFYLIKLKGYFSKLKAFQIYDNNYQYLFINLYLNPIIKSVQIIKYNKLIIPQSFIWKIFIEHLGQPKNFHLINKTINILLLWYQSKGFIWVQVKLINQNITNRICIKINEGLVKKIKFICESPTIINNELIDQMNLLIQRELRVYLGNILNAYSVEKGIKILKNKNHISSCHYKIVNYNNGVYILIKYSISDNQIIQYENNSYKRIGYLILLKQIYIYSYYYLNFYYFKYLSILTSLPSLSSYTKYINLLYKNKRQSVFTNIHINIYKYCMNTFIQKDINYKYCSFLNRYQDVYSIVFHLEPKSISFLGTYLLNRLCLYHYFFKKINFNVFNKLNYNKKYIALSKTKILYINLSSLQFYCRTIKSYILKYFKGYHDLGIYTNLYILLFEDISNNMYHLMCLSQHLYIYYKHRIHLDYLFLYFKKHIFNVSIKINLLTGENRYSYPLIFNFNQMNNMYLTFINTSNLEYNLSLTKYTWLYCFINLIMYGSTSYSITNSFSSLYFQRNSHLVYLNKYLGLGIQIDSFIKEVPPIRLEFIFDQKDYKLIHLYINYIYNYY